MDAGPTDGGSDASTDGFPSIDAKSDGAGADAITVRPDGDTTDSGGNQDQGSGGDSGGCGCRVTNDRSDDVAFLVACASLAIVVARRRRASITRPSR